MNLSYKESADKIIVSFEVAKIVDEAQINEIGLSLESICLKAADTRKRLVLNFRGVQFLSSLMLNRMIHIHRLSKQHAVDLRVWNLREEILEVFRITRLNNAFRIDDDPDPGPETSGSGIPRPTPPGNLDGHAEHPPS